MWEKWKTSVNRNGQAYLVIREQTGSNGVNVKQKKIMHLKRKDEVKVERLLHNKPHQKLVGLKQQLFILMGTARSWLIWTGPGQTALLQNTGLTGLGSSYGVGLMYTHHFSHLSWTSSLPRSCASHRNEGSAACKPNNLNALHASLCVVWATTLLLK